MTDEPQQPTTADIEKAGQVATAAGEAAAAAETPEEAREAAQQAARDTAKSVQLEITDDQAELIANKLVDVMESRGAFDAPPEPIEPPPPPAPVENPEQAAPPAEPAPQKKSPAQRFLGG